MASKVKTDDIFNLSEGDNDGHSDSDASGYNSDEAPRKKVTKKSTKSAPKKKNTVVFGLDDQDNSDDDDYSSQEEQEDDDEDDQDAPVSSDPRFQLNKPSSSSETKEDGEKKQRVRPKSKKQKLESLTPEALEKFQKAREKTGIVYLSKIPPFMKPIKLRHLLGQFGELGRVYLAPEGLFIRLHLCCQANIIFIDKCLGVKKSLTNPFSVFLLQMPRWQPAGKSMVATRNRTTPKVGSSSRIRRLPSRSPNPSTQP